jgi:hypothetical protein
MKDENVNTIQNKKTWKNRNSPNWCKTQRQEQPPTRYLKNMAGYGLDAAYGREMNIQF